MSEDIRKGRIVGMGSSMNHVDYEALKKGLETNKSKSPFTGFFDSLKDKPKEKEKEKD